MTVPTNHIRRTDPSPPSVTIRPSLVVIGSGAQHPLWAGRGAPDHRQGPSVSHRRRTSPVAAVAGGMPETEPSGADRTTRRPPDTTAVRCEPHPLAPHRRIAGSGLLAAASTAGRRCRTAARRLLPRKCWCCVGVSGGGGPSTPTARPGPRDRRDLPTEASGGRVAG